MKNISKQFAESAINFKDNYFLRARLKLTAYYASGMFVVVFLFSLAVYNLFAKNINDNFSDESLGAESSTAESVAIEKTKNQLQNIIIFADGLTIFLTIIGGYYLAGRTLEPIRKVYIKQKKFVADSAHELRTPLSVMKTGAEAILMGNSSREEYIKLTNDSLEEINFMSSMVNDLLFLAESDGFKKKEFHKLDFGKIVQNQVETMKAYAKGREVVMESQIEGEFLVNGEKNQLKRLTTNLIKNAIDYNESGGRVDVFLEKIKSYVVLRVIDTGIGIKKEKLKYIFDRFYKIDQSRMRELSGSGLGLAIVKEIADAHKGKIEITSEVGRGTEIKFFLAKTHS